MRYLHHVRTHVIAARRTQTILGPVKIYDTLFVSTCGEHHYISYSYVHQHTFVYPALAVHQSFRIIITKSLPPTYPLVN